MKKQYLVQLSENIIPEFSEILKEKFKNIEIVNSIERFSILIISATEKDSKKISKLENVKHVSLDRKLKLID